MSKSITEKAADIFKGMDPISLKEMDHVKLMQRTDTKFVLPSEKVPLILDEIRTKYRVLEIDNHRIHDYHTVYYDTPDFEMYHNHHNQRLNRYKVRVREYLTSGITFLEIKFKNNRRETIKKRIKNQNINDAFKSSDDFLSSNSPYSVKDLSPSLQNYFSRTTLVHKNNPERITIDLELCYENAAGEKRRDLPNISVIEVKRSKEAARSDMIDVLRKYKIGSMGFSKYCMGTVLTQENVKSNLFRKRIRRLGKIEKNFLIN